MLNDVCNIYYVTDVQNDFGEVIPTEVLRYTGLPCRIVEGSISETVVDGLISTSKKLYKCYFSPENDIDRLDIIEWNSLKLRVLNEKKDSTGNQYQIQAELIEG